MLRIVHASGDVKASGTMVGGIVGNGYEAISAPNTPCVSIENCYATGNISGLDNVGGIFGGESGIYINLVNGIGRIRNNYFAGNVSAFGDNPNVGAIIGFMKSADRYNDICHNYYVEGCGSSKGIGAVERLIDENFVETDSRFILPDSADADMAKEILERRCVNRLRRNYNDG